MKQYINRLEAKQGYGEGGPHRSGLRSRRRVFFVFENYEVKAPI